MSDHKHMLTHHMSVWHLAMVDLSLSPLALAQYSLALSLMKEHRQASITCSSRDCAAGLALQTAFDAQQAS